MKPLPKTIEIALNKSSETLKSAYALFDAISATSMRSDERDELISLFNRLCYCASKENHFIAEDLHSDETGELFNGFGRFWRCNSKLCSYCLSINARRNRKKLLNAIANDEKKFTNRYYFITLTLPNHNLPLLQIREIANRAWSMFRKSYLFSTHIFAGVKSEEFTFSKERYNYHLHLFVNAKFIVFQEIRRIWTRCVQNAFIEASELPQIATKDKLLMVKIHTISASANSFEKMSKELCKYITKNDSWQKIPKKDLIALAKIRRFSRMFELFGRWRNQTILDKTCITDGNDSNSKKPNRSNELDWRTYSKIYSSEKYIERLSEEFHLSRQERFKFLQIKFPFADFRDWDNQKINPFLE